VIAKKAIEAIVLHTINYKDSSKIVYVYSKYGQYNLLARGAKKLNSPLRFLCQPGNVIRFFANVEQKLPTIKEAELVEDYKTIKDDVLSYVYMSHILELVRNTISFDSNHEKMYGFLKKVFHLMSEKQDEEILTLVFELKLLYFLGNGLHFNGCTICDHLEDPVFHVRSGGLVCRHHVLENDDIYEIEIINLLMKLYYIDLSKDDVPDISANERVVLRHILDMLYDDFVGYKSKSRLILKQMKKY
jgi:DNA repair protein RecO (recombination protein O)